MSNPVGDLQDLTTFEAWGHIFLVLLKTDGLLVIVKINVNVPQATSIVDPAKTASLDLSSFVKAPRYIETLPNYFKKTGDAMKIAVGVISENGMTRVGWDVDKTGSISDLKSLNKRNQDMSTIFNSEGVSHKIFGFFYVAELNMVFYASEVKSAKAGGFKYKVAIHSHGSFNNFTSWDDFLEDYEDSSMRYHSSEVWTGNEYDVSIVEPKFHALYIQDRVYFAVSNHVDDQTENFIQCIFTDITWPGRIRFSRFWINKMFSHASLVRAPQSFNHAAYIS